MPSYIAANPWTDHVLKAMAELREQSSATAINLEQSQRDDLDRLISAGAALEALLGESDDPATQQHDILNVLGALRGYTEILLEDMEQAFPALQAVLERVLKTIASASSEDQGAIMQETSQLVSDLTGTILAVDDNADNRDLLTRYLNRSGHDSLVASSGQEALQLLEEHEVDLVLLDLIMPGMDGNEVLTRIKDNVALRPIPVIVISGRQDMEGIIECIEAGADDYLFKPFNPVLLQARIKAGLERKRWHDKEEQYRLQLERSEKFIRATFGRYVSDEIVDNLLEEPEGLKLGGDLREVTMLMSDIRQFSTICERLPPDQVMRMLNNYLGTMSEIIIGYQGTIDEFIGDAILAIFGAPIHREDDADRAVQCALDMQQAMQDINRENKKNGLPEISMGIGVNTGAVITGNIGSEKRSKYGVVGHHVNLTARIESQTAGGDILVSTSTLDKLQIPVNIGKQQQAQVKGINEIVTMHQILGNNEGKSDVV
ncbi:MAG: adenylate/guanylate cyclase domain-containing protein [Halieaceae bacterium]